MTLSKHHFLCLLFVPGLTLAGCTDSTNPASADTFSKRVVPVLEERCTAGVCHGVSPSLSDGSGVELPEESLYFRVDDRGRLKDVEAAQKKARRKINTEEDPIFSSLLRKPLAPEWGGTPHKGDVNFTSPHDPGFEALEAWIREQNEGGEDPEPAKLTPLQQQFADDVLPRLIQNNCAATNCHGPTAFNPFRLDPGIPSDGPTPRFSIEMIRDNYETARGFIALDGFAWAWQSRLIRKTLPLDKNGIEHRGGNQNFFRSPVSPGAGDILNWVQAEQTAVTEDRDYTDSTSGLLFVRGPVESRPPFSQSTFVPGRDLHALRPLAADGEVTNLTADLHDDPVDIRDPSVAPDGRTVVFAMRRSRDEGFHLWELDLESREAQRLTSGPDELPSGHEVTNVSPVHGPGEFLYFASNRHDTRAERGKRLDFDLYRMPVGGGEVERLTHTPSPELEPALFRVAPLSGYLVFSYRRAVDRRDQTIGFSLPLDFHTDYHIYFGRTAEPNLLHQFTELPDGRSAVVAGDARNAWAGGALAVVDRNLGPDLRPNTPPDDASLPAYASTYRPLDPSASPTGWSAGGIYRDPVALPNGTLIVAHAPSAVDLTDADASPRYRLERLELEETSGVCPEISCNTRIDSRKVLVDVPDVSVFDPEPIRAWIPRGKSPPKLDPTDDAEPGLYSMAAPTVNNGIMTNLSPSGPKTFRDDIAYVRFIEALPARPDRWGPIDAPERLSKRATDSTAGVHMPARILGEVPVREDGSLFVQLPSNTPFRTQFLNEERMAIGRQHNRWLYVWPGQHFTQSTRPRLYDERCGGCHGSSSGNPVDAWRKPDATSSASLTMARYEYSDPRRPRDPRQLGEQTRRTVDFRSNIEPILEASCRSSGCHAAQSAAGGLDLSSTETEHYSVAYENLLQTGDGSGSGMRYVDQAASRARSSYLVEVLTGRELDAPRAHGDHPTVDLSEDELTTIVRWIETGAHYDLSRTDATTDGKSANQ